MSPDQIQITAFEYNGQLVSINSRGLAALSEAGMTPTNLVIIDKSEVPRNILKRLKETTALGEQLPSRNIAVTPSRADKTVLRIISIPGGS